jgi:hypothetical protein
VRSPERRLKLAVKRRLFPGERRPLRVRHGPARGIRFLGTRQHDLRREFGVWESELTPWYRRWITPGRVVWDVGAHDGYTALLYAQLGARVEAFEPDPSACERLLANLRLNPGLEPLVTLRAFGIEPGTDLSSLPPPDVVKVDVDEAEPAVRDALLPLLSARRPFVVWEVHGATNESESRDALISAGYEVRLVRNARWKTLSPEYRPLPGGVNRWLVAWPPA